MIAVQSLTVDNIIGLVIALVLVVYLIVALIIPEKF
ncbi:MAG TPA: K(+)-transporting ATPase subunit F [Acidimicrobiales bacterium]|nr:K(+)-transporting ATPase subunit F [Acidimicrobiales bacterium]